MRGGEGDERFAEAGKTSAREADGEGHFNGDSVQSSRSGRAVQTAVRWMSEERREIPLKEIPLRVFYERLVTLPTRPWEGDGKVELREARREAWARIKAGMPKVFERTEARSGWIFETVAGRNIGALRWEVYGSASTVRAEGAEVGWSVDELGALDARLMDQTGNLFARIVRNAGDGSVMVEHHSGLLTARPWVSWTAGAGASGAGLEVSHGWVLVLRGATARVSGPEGGERFRLADPVAGWAMEGGWEKARP